MDLVLGSFGPLQTNPFLHESMSFGGYLCGVETSSGRAPPMSGRVEAGAGLAIILVSAAVRTDPSLPSSSNLFTEDSLEKVKQGMIEKG